MFYRGVRELTAHEMKTDQRRNRREAADSATADLIPLMDFSSQEFV